MPAATTITTRTSDYQPGLAWFATIGSVWVFVLVMLGAFTTSIGAGMIFEDWPLSNGSLNPEGWLTDIMMFAEHSHRLSAGMMSIITIAIWLAVRRWEARAWVRKVALGAVVLVFAQALVGGLRVLLDPIILDFVSVGRLFAMLHAILAQVYICTLLAIALGLSRMWIASQSLGASMAVRRLGKWCCALLLLQLAIAAVMRHSYAGMAIPSFPLSSPEGDLLPPLWNFRVGIHFAHRVMAVVLTVALVRFAISVWRDHEAHAGYKAAAAGVIVLLVGQIVLGASVIWMSRNPYVTTGHVLCGALLLALTFAMTMWANHTGEKTSA
ncbi:COX15/CtaA family protein [Synoicihabitans lomoniglobus]|uniref:COX15/CtaA family protein n=1 Tax=Synoicihabitans lomoniglobus TaxID=2909285 RepID=A0AAE9ZU32_9BACT|nr:COX15/CtaA family protein [Opitutaceae bacterium LMO-M01]WED63084.1 COX15/CtaA family protein [Opitutaceae bacterium LMO-M01]